MPVSTEHQKKAPPLASDAPRCTAVLLKQVGPQTRAPEIESVWPANSSPSSLLLAVGQLALIAGKPVRREVLPAQQTNKETIVASPLGQASGDESLRALAVIEPRRRQTDSTGSPPDPMAAADPLDDSNMAESAIRLLAEMNQHSGFAAASMSLVNELARLTGASRVSLGVIRDGSVAVTTMSGTPTTNGRTTLQRDLGLAMNEAIEQACTIVYPSTERRTATVTLNHGRFTIRHGSPVLCTVPMPVADESGRALIGAVSLEFDNDRAVDLKAIRFVENIASLLSPGLDARRRLSAPVTGNLVGLLAGGTRKALGKPNRRKRHVLLTLAALVLVAMFIPLPSSVVADARIEGAGQRVLTAPRDGFISTVHFTPGSQVDAGQLLVSLDNRELMLEQERWQSQLHQSEKQYGEALASGNQSSIAIERARLAQARAQLESLQAQMERMRIVAPFDGLVLDGDLSQAIGAPVQRGQTLLRLAPAGEHRVVINVDEREIGRIAPGSTGQLVLAAFDSRELAVQVDRINPVAQISNGTNVFEVNARLAPGTQSIQPGLKGIVKVAAGRQSLIGRLTQRLRHWVRMTTWRWQP